MSISGIISAIGNNSGIAPLFVRDCLIETPTKVYLTYKQNEPENKKIAYLAARERLIDEYAVGFVWLFGFKIIEEIAKKLMALKGLNSDVNIKLLKEDEFQGLELNEKNSVGRVSKTITDELKNVNANKKLFQRCAAGKFAAATIIPIALMGWVIPKLIFASTAKKLEEAKQDGRNAVGQEAKPNQRAKNASSLVSLSSNNPSTVQPLNNSAKPSFGSGGVLNAMVNCSEQTKMIFIDSGYAVGRGGTARNKDAFWDIEFKMTGMLLLNFVAPKYIAKALDRITGANLDPIILADDAFRAQIEAGTLKLPKLKLPKKSKTGDPYKYEKDMVEFKKAMFEFIDANPDSLFIKFADKLKKIKMLKVDDKISMRDPRAWVDVEALGKFRDQIAEFTQNVKGKDVAKILKRAKGLKYFNILTNIGLSSFLLAYCLPKAQFAFRERVLGTKLEPGIEGESKKIGAC